MQETAASDRIEIFICNGASLTDGGKGVRFPLMAWGQDASGFAVRFGGIVHAYLNRCAHVPIELDWQEGEFFDSTGLYLMCSTHGAIYQPETGFCAGGPCKGGRLKVIKVSEHDQHIYWLPDESMRPISA